MHQSISKCRIAMLERWWYSSLVTYFIDGAVNNAWHLHKICNGASLLTTSLLLVYRENISDPVWKPTSARQARQAIKKLG